MWVFSDECEPLCSRSADIRSKTLDRNPRRSGVRVAKGTAMGCGPYAAAGAA
jgi:hypothetical protein